MKTITVIIGPEAERSLQRFLFVRGLTGQDNLCDSVVARLLETPDGETARLLHPKDKEACSR